MACKVKTSWGTCIVLLKSIVKTITYSYSDPKTECVLFIFMCILIIIKKKLNITIEEAVSEEIKRYAEKHNNYAKGNMATSKYS